MVTLEHSEVDRRLAILVAALESISLVAQDETGFCNIVLLDCIEQLLRPIDARHLLEQVELLAVNCFESHLHHLT